VAPEALLGGTPEDNAQITRDILAGTDRGPRRDVVVLNAAAALWAGGAESDLASGVRSAERSIDTGAALRALEGLIAFSQEAAA
jgi:anthranilate phosphoribosyltransferase